MISAGMVDNEVNLTMFSLNNVKNLYDKYAQETNQPLINEAVQQIYEQTCVQPLLVNRLGAILTVNIKPNTTDIILPQDVDIAINRLLKEDNDHIGIDFSAIISYLFHLKYSKYSENFVNIDFERNIIFLTSLVVHRK